MVFRCLLCSDEKSGEVFAFGTTCQACQRPYSVCVECRDKWPAAVRDIATKLKAAWAHEQECGR